MQFRIMKMPPDILFPQFPTPPEIEIRHKQAHFESLECRIAGCREIKVIIGTALEPRKTPPWGANAEKMMIYRPGGSGASIDGFVRFFHWHTHPETHECGLMGCKFVMWKERLVQCPVYSALDCLPQCEHHGPHPRNVRCNAGLKYHCNKCEEVKP